MRLPLSWASARGWSTTGSSMVSWRRDVPRPAGWAWPTHPRWRQPAASACWTRPTSSLNPKTHWQEWQHEVIVPSFEDKVLQRAVVMVLEPIYEQDFRHCGID